MAKTTKKEVVAEPKVKKAKGAYHLKITVNETVFEVDTDNLTEALKAYEAPTTIKTDVVFIATKGDKQADYTVNVFKGRRAFNNRTALELVAINLVKRLG